MLRQTITSQKRNPPRQGTIHAVELLLLLPIILGLILGMVEYSMILSIDQQLAVASRQGARVAAQGGSAAEVEAAARLVLGSGNVGLSALVTSQLTDVSGDPVSVSVTVADAASVVPNMLNFLGFSIKDQPLAGLTIMRKE
ncbi:MAG TPA: TadE/TadG family type IV pilus assembly protein [Gemmataceae bacterium]|jgi:Flp pilus assembly protein TadG|nr:TadE/TadG family type IV pilus assembly protein [Gemmataceae bacterium]